MDVTERLRAWATAHAQARQAERAAEQGRGTDDAGRLQRDARSLREQADRLHRQIYRELDGGRGN